MPSTFPFLRPRSVSTACFSRRGQTRLWVLPLIAIVCGGGGLLAGRMLSRPAATPAIQEVPGASTTAATSPVAVAPVAPAPQKTIEVMPPAIMPPAVASSKRAPAELAPPKPRDVAADPATSGPLAKRTIVYGKSVEGTALTATILGDGPNVTLFFGAFHGNEPITDDMVNRLRDYLEANPQLLTGYRVILAPVVNPDGLSRGKRANARGVDLNRNFPGTWQKAATKARYNPGPSVASEPETQAVIKLIEEFQPSKIVSFHQPFHTMNYTGEPGRRLAETMKKYNQYPITPDIGYPTPGSFGDYCGRKLKIAIVTYELPAQSADAAWKANRSAFLAAIRQ